MRKQHTWWRKFATARGAVVVALQWVLVGAAPAQAQDDFTGGGAAGPAAGQGAMAPGYRLKTSGGATPATTAEGLAAPRAVGDPGVAAPGAGEGGGAAESGVVGQDNQAPVRSGDAGFVPDQTQGEEGAATSYDEWRNWRLRQTAHPAYPAVNDYSRPYSGMFPQAAQALGYAPPGLVLPLTLMTAISSRTTKKGDTVEATVNRNVPLQGYAYIPAGSIVSGNVDEARGSSVMEREGSLNLTFDRLSLPNGRTYPISAHLLGGLGTVGQGGISYEDLHGGLGWRQRMESTGLMSGFGNIVSGAGALGWGAATGENFARAIVSPTSVVGALSVVGNMLRRGHEVILPAGIQFQIRLDSALQIDNTNMPPRYASRL